MIIITMRRPKFHLCDCKYGCVRHKHARDVGFGGQRQAGQLGISG